MERGNSIILLSDRFKDTKRDILPNSEGNCVRRLLPRFNSSNLIIPGNSLGKDFNPQPLISKISRKSNFPRLGGSEASGLPVKNNSASFFRLPIEEGRVVIWLLAKSIFFKIDQSIYCLR